MAATNLHFLELLLHLERTAQNRIPLDAIALLQRMSMCFSYRLSTGLRRVALDLLNAVALEGPCLRWERLDDLDLHLAKVALACCALPFALVGVIVLGGSGRPTLQTTVVVVGDEGSLLGLLCRAMRPGNKSQ